MSDDTRRITRRIITVTPNRTAHVTPETRFMLNIEWFDDYGRPTTQTHLPFTREGLQDLNDTILDALEGH